MSHRGGGGGRGRGEYYKQKYGGGGRGRGGGGGGGGGGYGGGRGDGTPRAPSPERMDSGSSGPARSASELQAILRRIDGAGYGAYRDMEGAFDFAAGSSLPFRLFIDRVQSDPFAPPSRMRALIAGPVAAFPKESYSSAIRAVALADFLTRAFVSAAQDAGDDQRTESGGWSGKKGGEITMEPPGQHVLSRSSTLISPSDGSIEARFTIALPARGRSIEGQWAMKILMERLPALLHKALLFNSLDAQSLRRHVLSVEDQEALRQMLPQAGAVGFVRNGALLPRLGGHSDKPMEAANAVLFQSPPNLEREVRLPNIGAIRGMLLPKGITVIVGGGFHGKSTLLQALEVGVYNHVPGDGREFVCVDPSAVKIRAEDGRCVTQVNISPFIDNLPFKKDTRAFTTQDASGSTSQATNIIEAIEVGSGLLLMDEDTSATNFLIRDLRMQMLVSREQEPITPFISKVRALYTQLGISTVMVIGGSGDYFDVADHVIAMDHYLPSDRTADASAISERFASGSNGHLGVVQIAEFGSTSIRYPIGASLQVSGKVVARGREKLSYGELDIDLSYVEQLVELGQTRAIGAALKLLASRIGNGVATKGVRELTEELEGLMDGPQGLDALEPAMRLGNMARPRRFEIAAALGRFRALQATSKIMA